MGQMIILLFESGGALPRIAMLLLSVAPDVKIISADVQPISSEICEALSRMALRASLPKMCVEEGFP
ncbi:hypothetical protein BLX42_16360 [Pseudomonas sp. SG-MS2]|nr:hypothetical protein BLX42_16360 [Pseudomonas sp. SG-MS2]